jgi:phytoene dehydrogenase-like protein
MWDAICVGSGITALAFGAEMALRHQDQKVLVLEKHFVPGGYATTFQRRQTRFDCSLHKLSGMGRGGNLERIFGSLGLHDELEMYRPEVYFEAVHRGESLRLSNHYETFQAQLLSRFPSATEALQSFFREIEVHGKNGYYQFQIVSGSYTPEVEDLRYARKHLKALTVSEALDRRFADPLLKELLAAPGIYVGGFADDLGYLYYLHVLYATLFCGTGYPRGGSRALSEVLAARVRSAGGDVLMRTEVLRVLVDDAGHAYGVETERGTFFARQIYINVSPHVALDRLLPNSPALGDAKAKLEALIPSWSTTTVYIETDASPEELGFTASEAMIVADDFQQAEQLRRRCRAIPGPAAERLFWHLSTMEATNYHRLDASGGRVLCLNVLDTIDHWPMRRTPEYKEKKDRARDVLLARLYEAFPGLRGHVAYTEVSSPHTYERFTFNHRGAGYGALVGKDAKPYLFHYNFPIRGVHFLSAWVAGPSYEAAFGYAEMKAQTYCADWEPARAGEGRGAVLEGLKDDRPTENCCERA